MTRPKNKHLISFEAAAFITDRKARQLSPRSIQFYDDELRYFQQWTTTHNILHIEDLDAPALRQYLIDLSARRNPGGIHAAFRAIKAFLNWFDLELDDPAFKNPILKVTPPSPSKEPLPGIPLDHVRRLMAACDPKSELGLRDRAIFAFLVDTGVRKEEMVSLNVGDVDSRTGAVHVRHGKGNKSRIVFLAAKPRRELNRYLRTRNDLEPARPLWLSRDGTRLTQNGLRMMVQRRADQAHLPAPGLHDFRRTFAIESLRNGMDLVTLMHLMGHTSISVLQRYLKLVERDLQRGHEDSSPGDKL